MVFSTFSLGGLHVTMHVEMYHHT